MRVRTNPTDWATNTHPIIIPLSVYSRINEGLEGDLKIKALLSLFPIPSNRNITILICEGAHLNCLSLKVGGMDNAIKTATLDANNLKLRFHNLFQGHRVVLWNQYVKNNILYNQFNTIIHNLYCSDNDFKHKINIDSEKSLRHFNGDDKLIPELLKCARLDMLEHCVYLLIIARLGYRYEFYPGKRESSAEYINNKLLTLENRIIRVNVSLPFFKRNDEKATNLENIKTSENVIKV